ncbi:MAG: 3-isopropylmalate dehydrogenase [Gemmatimonadetes bacterium]|nr:3-isopropylmalate dehydrogenase [Gemmatimonadota bacterium]
MAEIDIVALPGDGVGPEVTDAMISVLTAVSHRYGHSFTVRSHDIGWAAFERHGTVLPDETLAAARTGPAVFLGAVGDPRAEGLSPSLRPESALLRLRSELGCFANLRPARVDAALAALSPLRPDLAAGCDLLIVRELTGGLYYGTPRHSDGVTAVNTLRYTDMEVERIARVAFDAARARRSHVTSIDKANVLEVSQLWREVVTRVSSDYPDVTLAHMLVDRAAMEMVMNPSQFDVILTTNMFGDILSDEASALTGSVGLLASASVGGSVGIYEPVHGPDPDLASKGVANPIGAIRTGALMLSHSFALHGEAAAIEEAIQRVLARGLRTRDIAAGGPSVGTTAFAAAVTEKLT